LGESLFVFAPATAARGEGAGCCVMRNLARRCKVEVQVTFNETKAIAEQAAEGLTLPFSGKKRDDYCTLFAR